MKALTSALWYLVRLPFKFFFFYNIFKIIKNKNAKAIPVWMKERGKAMLDEEWLWDTESTQLKK